MIRKKCLCLILSVFLLTLTFSSFLTVPSGALTKEGLEEQINALEKEKAEIQEKLSAAEAEESDALANKRYYDTLVADTQNQIDAATVYTAELEEKISAGEDHKAALDAQIKTLLEEFKSNLAASYQNDRNISMLEIILNSKSLREFMVNVERSAAVLNYRNNIAKELNDSLAEQTRLVSELETEKSEQQATQTLLSEKQAELAQQQEQASKYLSEVQADEELLRQSIEEAEAAEDSLRAQMNSILAAEWKKRQQEQTTPPPQTTLPPETQEDTPDPVPTPQPVPETTQYVAPTPSVYFTWPLRGYYTITCNFGETDAWGVNPHRGTDIYCPTGTPIYACAGGTVMTAAYHWSWGNYVQILHDNGMTTLYAHCSSLAVSKGQTVSSGQLIAYSGATGTVTGPHLHLEMQVYSGGAFTLVNPLSYLSY